MTQKNTVKIIEIVGFLKMHLIYFTFYSYYLLICDFKLQILDNKYHSKLQSNLNKHEQSEQH